MSATIVDFKTRHKIAESTHPFVRTPVPPSSSDVALINKIAAMVEILEELALETKQGRIESFGFAVVRPSGAANAYFSDSDNMAGLIGAAALLQNRLACAVDEPDDEEDTSGPGCG